MVLREDAHITSPPDHPPVPTASWPALPANFSDLPPDSTECWNSHFSFSFTTYFLWSEAAKTQSPIYSTFSPPITHNRTYTGNFATDCTTTTYGLTTLCDGVPRAESRRSQCRDNIIVTSDVWYQYSTLISYRTATWTSSYKQVQPTCKPAPDGSDLCTRLYDAYTYRSSLLKSETTLAPSYLGTLYNMIGPRCTRTSSATTTNTDTSCRLYAKTYSAYYWPTPAPSGSEFCESSTKPTPTITGPPKTAVISGHTLTSPSVYHFLRDIRLDSASPGARRWNVSTTLPPSAAVLTVAQRESDILSAYEYICRGIEADFCSVKFTADFRVHDVRTVRAEAYSRDCSNFCSLDGDGVLYQSNFRADIAVPVSEIVAQNGEVVGGKDCVWDLQGPDDEGYRSYITSSIPAVVFVNVQNTVFVPIETAGGGGVVTGTPGAMPGGSMGEATPTPTPAG